MMHRFLWWMALSILLTLISCSAKDDAGAIRKLIENSAAVAEKHQISELMQLTTEDFNASPGNHDKRTVRGILFGYFKRYGQFAIHYPRPSVDVTDGSRASAMIYFMILSKERTLPGLKELYDDPLQWIEQVGEKAELYQLRLDLVKKNADWRVRQAHIERFKGNF
jgi:hypothetical protein